MNIEISSEAFILLIGLPALAVTLLLLRRKRSASSLFFIAVFWIYLCFLIGATLFPIDLSPDTRAWMRSQAGFSDRMNLIPFYFGPFGSLWRSRDMLLSNILLTVPFGFGIGFVARVRPRDLRWLPLAVGFGIEGAQFGVGLLLGYPYRVLDINDTLMNALGVVAGYGLFWLLARLMLWLDARNGSRLKGLAGEMVLAAERSLGEDR
ncbi:glycopeptide antibiotics resistance protein [Longilinea arvoryzae]|uniref:Glycopeptide antibiotics resistance protein n=1 Tax=Longilinea arvoryzae TaxID=360412 RepID=A0A0K8MXP6_9CHLR|nr:VanZ family protein [Longilinea arvoryzae]GAP16024.1 glycopeptide antibiotics resistance protein [Longilinea arvoryzae]